MGVEHDDFLGEAAEALDQRVQLATRLQPIESAEAVQDALDEAPVHTRSFSTSSRSAREPLVCVRMNTAPSSNVSSVLSAGHSVMQGIYVCA